MKTLAIDDTGQEIDAQMKHFGGPFFGADFLKNTNSKQSKSPETQAFRDFYNVAGVVRLTHCCAIHPARRPKLYKFRYPPRIFSLKIMPQAYFFTLKAPRFVQVFLTKSKKKQPVKTDCFSWQG